MGYTYLLANKAIIIINIVKVICRLRIRSYGILYYIEMGNFIKRAAVHIDLEIFSCDLAQKNVHQVRIILKLSA